MAGFMKRIAKRCFPKATQTIDHFHVHKRAIEALQELRISHRWKAIEQENNLLTKAKEEKKISKLKFLKIAIPESNFWQEAGIYFIKTEKNGLCRKISELK